MVIGWDIGGVNTKVARVAGGTVRGVRGRPFELQRAPDTLSAVLRELAREIGAEPDDAHAVTMTAELSQMFRTKREGVAFVLDALDAAFSGARVRVFSVEGGFVDPAEARRRPLSVAAANWAATAHLVAVHHPDAVLIDVGTTTADIIPIAAGLVVAAGRSDPERLASGELIYTGALRTPVEAIAASVPFRATAAGVSAEGFALAGDVHLWRGDIAEADYTVPTPDGRPPSREFAGERLARVVCADRELLDDAGITAIADAVAAAQVGRIADGIRQVMARHPGLRAAVVTGLGAFLGKAAAQAAGLHVIALADALGPDAARCAPAACVALLLEASREGRPDATRNEREAGRPRTRRRGGPLTVVKLGGSLLAHREHFDAAIAAIAAMAHLRSVVIVPGGGPFADAVREVDARIGVSDDAAHWMAILAMDQHAHVIAEHIAGGVVATGAADVGAALDRGRVPVLAPSRWLRDTDPLPHSWDVTSDSIAAWVAQQLAAERLVLVKFPGAGGTDLIDRHFASIISPGIEVTVTSADALGPRPQPYDD